MIPIRDSIPSTRTPVVTIGLIAVTALVFLLQVQDPQGDLIERYGLVPARLFGGGGPLQAYTLQDTVYGLVREPRELAAAAIPDWLTLFTCVFLHGGFLHFAGNMWFLWVFGDNVEERMGRLGFLGFYLVAGVLASLTHLLTQQDSTVPTIGASGAIAGVMGAYMLLYPKSQVLTLLPIFFLFFVVIPAPVFLGIWFLLQFFQGTMSLSNLDSGGVAWWAHIGGFAFGALVAWGMRMFDWLQPPPPTVVFTRRRPAPGRRGGWDY